MTALDERMLRRAAYGRISTFLSGKSCTLIEVCLSFDLEVVKVVRAEQCPFLVEETHLILLASYENMYFEGR